MKQQAITKTIGIWAIGLIAIASGLTMIQTQAATPSVDGALTVTAANSVINQYSTITAINAGAGTITVPAIAALTSGAPVGGGALAIGDLLMLYQAKGATITTTNTAAYGTVTALNGAGLYSFATVQAVAGNVITIVLTGGGNCALPAFDVAFTQVIRVPQLSSLTVNPAPASVVAAPWNGTIGGVVVASVTGATTLNNTAGSINVSQQGFRGGATDLNPTSPAGAGVINDFVLATDATAAPKGEGIAGATGGDFARGAPANGGGGGNGHNAGGGGGSNGGSTVGYNGTGLKSLTVPGWAAAWNLEAAGFATDVSPGGGRGGYTFSQSNQNALVLGTSQAAWTGDFRDNVGGFGGRPLDYSAGAQARVFFGGGGGTGDYNGGAAAPTNGGGDGGGLVYLITGSVAGTGSVLANGQAGNDGSTTDSGSGAGAGGAIIIRSTSAVPAGINLNANGAAGGNQPGAGGGEAEGPGGGGGGGFIAATGATQTANGGANGTTTATQLSEFIPNGATSGAAGTINAAPPTDNNSPFCFTPRIGVAKTVGAVTVSGANNQFYNVPYTVLIRSYGENLTSVQVNDVLSSITPTGATINAIIAGPTVSGVTAGSSITANTPANLLSTGNLLTTSAGNTLVRQTNGTDGEATITFTVQVRPPAGSTPTTIYNNVATGTGTYTGTGGLVLNTTDASDNNTNPDPDADRQPNEAGENDPTPVALPVADLSVTKIVSNATPVVGSNVTFTITVSNSAGSSNATAVTVQDLLPAGYTFVSATPSGATTYNPGTGVWTVGTLNGGLNATLLVVATVGAVGPYVNTAQVSASGLPDPDSIPNNNVAAEDDQASVTVTPFVSPTLTKTFNPTYIAPGQTSSLTISLGNSNASALTLTQALTDNLPTNVTTASAGTTTCTGTGAVTITATSVTLPVTRTIPTGGCTITVDVTSTVVGSYTNVIPAGAAGVGLLTNAGAAPSASAPLVVLEPIKTVRLVTDADTSGTPSVGDTIQYQIVYALPTGSPTIANFQIFDVLPSQVTYTPNASSPALTLGGGQTATTAGAAYLGTNASVSSAALLNAPVTLIAGGSITATINAVINNTATLGTPFDNTARANGTGLPAVTGNGTGGGLASDADATPFGVPASALPQPNDTATTGQATQVTAVAPNADISVVKSQASPAVVDSGGTITYTVTVTNNGPAIASNVIVADTLPAGATFVSASGGGSVAGSVVTWNGGSTPALNSLANGASQVFSVVVTAP